MRSVISEAYVPENGESCVSSVVCGHRDSVKRGCGHFFDRPRPQSSLLTEEGQAQAGRGLFILAVAHAGEVVDMKVSLEGRLLS